MREELPAWRIDNIIPLILIVGSFFVYLVRLSILETKVDSILQNQVMLSSEFKDWKKQAEMRLGSVEIGVAQIKTIVKMQ